MKSAYNNLMAIKTVGTGRHIIDIRPWGYKGKRVRLPFEGSREEAERYHAEVLASFGRQKTYTDKRISDIAPEYLEWVRFNQAEKTHLDKRKMVWNQLVPHFGGIKPDLLTPQLIDQYVKKRMPRRRAANLELLCLSHMLKWANERNMCSAPMKIRGVKQIKSLPDTLSPQEVSTLIENVDTSFYYTLFLTMYLCGLRKEECLALKWNQVDFESRRLIILGKGGKTRPIPMSDTLAECLAGHARLAQDKSSWVWASPAGGDKLYDVKKALKRAAERAGITRRVHSHMLRHSWATHLLQGGTDIRIIQKGLGHASIQTTSIYAHVAFPDLERAVNRLDTMWTRHGQTGK